MPKHPHHFAILAIFLGLLSIGLAIVVEVSVKAQTLPSTNAVICSYTTGEWSACSSSGKQTRSISKTPTGCYEDATSVPLTERSCNYITSYPATAVACSYTYSSWNACGSSGKQTRSIISKTPTGCYDTAAPFLEQSCTYVNPATTTTVTKTICAYTLSEWSACTSSGTQTRNILSRYPSGCYDSTMPNLQRTCTATATTTTATISNTTSAGTTTCSYSYSNWSDCSSSGKQNRVVTAKTPSGCRESVIPYTERTCTYVATTTINSDVACAYSTSEWSTCDSSGKQTRVIISRTPSGCYDSNVPVMERICTSTLSLSGGTAAVQNASTTTPTFNFLNINGGEVISDNIKIQGIVTNAYNVEFYLISADSNIPKYLGLAKKIEGDVWEYSFDSKTQPNGSYYIRAKIKNTYGSYEGGQRMLVILNAVENSDAVSISQTPKEEIPALISQKSQESAIPSDQTSGEWQKKYFKSETCVDENICGGMADPDKDGLNNNDEYRYGTNPTNPDSDNDGFLDGDEVKNGYDPLKASPGDKSDKIVFESPKESGEVKKDFYQVNKVEMVEAQAENENNKIKISGKGIPNSFVTIYIYSDPIILTVKTDSDGNWSYEIDKEIEDGEHQVYVAVTDNTGKITAKSEPLMFVKTAQAITVIPSAEAATGDLVSPTKNQTKKDIFFFLTLIIGGLALALASIGLYKHNIYKKEISDPN
jgi:hypothetical protein